MTTYLCADVRHRRGSAPRDIDVTAQVRLERELQPRAGAYLAHTERLLTEVPLVSEVHEARRIAAMRELLAGRPDPWASVVVLASERSVGRPAGLYELDELSASTPWIDRLVSSPLRSTAREEVLIVDEPTLPVGVAPSTELVTGNVLLAPGSDTRVLPQGVYYLDELAMALAQAPSDEASIIEAIRRTPDLVRVDLLSEQPWRVVIDCPELEGNPAQRHQVCFTGEGSEPAIVYGTPVDGWDAIIESSVASDLAPPLAVRRMERRVSALLLAESLTAALALSLAWSSGALAMAARETPGWLGFSVVLLLGSLLFAAMPLVAPSEIDGNANDTLVIGRFYRSRLELLGWGAVLSATLFALAAMAALVPPLAVDPATLPPASVTFNSTDGPIYATVALAGDGIATDRTVVVDVRAFGPGDAVGTLIAHLTTTGDAEGHVGVIQSIALANGTRYVSVGVRSGDDESPTCGPTTSAPGCTVVSVPQPGTA
jgi:hypothetical protein